MEEKKIWELESAFNEAFNEAVKTMYWRAKEGNPFTLREVMEFGFNNVHFNGKLGYELDDFTENELNTKVEYCYYDVDEDGYRTAYLEEVE